MAGAYLLRIPPGAIPAAHCTKKHTGYRTMAKKVEFELDMDGLRELKKGAEMQAILDAAGQTVASIAGGEYGYRTHIADYTAICNVYPDSKEAAKDNYENNTLLKALGSAGLSMRK